MKGLFVFSHKMEDGEALTTRALLKRAGLDVTTITFEETLEIETSYGLKVKADAFGTDVQAKDYDFIVVPGGPYVAKIVDQDVNIKALATQFHQKQKLVAAICAGPRFLGQAGILDGKQFTAYTGTEVDMPKGIYLKNQKSVVDENIITARGAGAVVEFAYEIIKYLLGKDKADQMLKDILF